MLQILYVSSTNFMQDSGAIKNNAYFYGTLTLYGVAWCVAFQQRLFQCVICLFKYSERRRRKKKNTIASQFDRTSSMWKFIAKRTPISTPNWICYSQISSTKDLQIWPRPWISNYGDFHSVNIFDCWAKAHKVASHFQTWHIELLLSGIWPVHVLYWIQWYAF